MAPEVKPNRGPSVCPPQIDTIRIVLPRGGTPHTALWRRKSLFSLERVLSEVTTHYRVQHTSPG